MKTIKINFALTPEIQKRIFKIVLGILLGCALFYGMFRIYQFTQAKITSGDSKFRECDLKLGNQTIILNDTLQLYLACNSSFSYINKSYYSCSDMLSSKNGNISKMEMDLTSYRIDLKNCEIDRDSYETKYDKCRKDLNDCEDA